MFRRAMFHRHGRFLIAAGLGLVLWLAALQWSGLDPVLQAVSGVNGFLICYLALTLQLILATTPDTLRRHSEADDEGAALILVLALMAVGISLAAVFMVLNRPEGGLGPSLFALASVPMGWAMLQILAAFRYAHLYYAPDPDAGLSFPGDQPPGVWDFLYFSFTIGMTAQVSDVVVTTSALRKLVLLHSIGAFFFNTVILAMAVNAALALTK